MYRRCRKLTPEEAAYLAGLIDGEGTIALSRRHRNEQRQLVVSISNTERDLLDWAKAVTGVGKITRKRTVSVLHAPGLAYAVSNRQALDVLRQVYPYLRSYKHARADLVLQQYLLVTPRNGKYTATLSASRLQFEEKFAALTPQRLKCEPPI